MTCPSQCSPELPHKNLPVQCRLSKEVDMPNRSSQATPPDSEGGVVVCAEVAPLAVGAEGVRPPQRTPDPPPHHEELLALLTLGGTTHQ